MSKILLHEGDGAGVRGGVSDSCGTGMRFNPSGVQGVNRVDVVVGKSAGVGKLVDRWSEVEEAVVRIKTDVTVITISVPMGAMGVESVHGSMLHAAELLSRR